MDVQYTQGCRVGVKMIAGNRTNELRSRLHEVLVTNTRRLLCKEGRMCTNYAAARRDRLFRHFGVEPPDSPWRDDVYKDYPAPIIRRTAAGTHADVATFGMVPRKHIPPGVRVFDTMNARAETVGEKRSFSGAWKRQQLCLVPCDAFYEPNYESGKAVRWRINMASGEPFAIAGLWREWDDGEDGKALSFTMLTVNSNEHPLMRRFHKPGDEKRSVVILRPHDYEGWLASRSMDEARTFLNLYPPELMHAEACPGPPRASKAKGSGPVEESVE